ncbi:MAG: hypothetical protein R2771_06305 [Saprospiraceae bacterium]
MISVQNHHLLSNGNKFLILFLSVILFTSCFATKKNTTVERHPKTYYPEKKDTVVVKSNDTKVDSLEWEDNEVIETVHKKDDNNENKNSIDPMKKDQYKIDVLIPMDSYGVFSELSDLEQSTNTYNMVEYYAGMILALVDLKTKGADFVVNVHDIPVDADINNSYIKEASKDKPDVIIGPNDKNQLLKVLDFAESNKILVVPPWKSFSNITTEDQFYIQIKPTLETYYVKMIEDIESFASKEDVYVISRDEDRDKARVDKFLELREKVTGDTGKYNTIFINEMEMLTDTSIYQEKLKDQLSDKYIIFPNYSYADDDFLFNSLRSLNIEKGNTNVFVYGMPVMMESDKINYDLFKRLNIRIIDDNYIDDSNREVKQFKYDFYKQFNSFPTEFAFEGYDMMSFIGTGLIDYGVMFAPFIEDKVFDYTSTGYKIEPNISYPDEKSELPHFNYYENKNLYIIGFINNKFVKLR